MQCISVDLPDPDGPMIAVNRLRSEPNVDGVERDDPGVPGAVDLGQRHGSGRGGAVAAAGTDGVVLVTVSPSGGSVHDHRRHRVWSTTTAIRGEVRRVLRHNSG